MKFLKEHCELAWANAVSNCNKIFDGLVDIEQEKAFVSSFHNAIELCFKQIMIDETKYEVVDYGKMNPEDSRDYLNSKDLNNYFENLSIEKLDKLFSIEFNKLIDIFGTIEINGQSINIKGKLKLLNAKRNNETHFYISNNIEEYLSFSDFKELCELMTLLFMYLSNNQIISSIDFKKDSNSTFYHLNFFDIKEYQFISYYSYILNSDKNKKILKNLNKFNKNKPNRTFKEFSYNKDDLYEAAYSLYTGENCDEKFEIEIPFFEFYRRFKILTNCGEVIINECIETTMFINGNSKIEQYISINKK